MSLLQGFANYPQVPLALSLYLLWESWEGWLCSALYAVSWCQAGGAGSGEGALLQFPGKLDWGGQMGRGSRLKSGGLRAGKQRTGEGWSSSWKVREKDG